VAIVDWNGFQSDGLSKEVIDNGQLAKRWSGFGWNVLEIDGHSFTEIQEACNVKSIQGIPTVILARTIKGQGISFMENNNTWHHNRLTEDAYLRAVSEIETS
jgi:transketolase